VLTWYDERGRPHLALTPDEVPEAARVHVVVTSLGRGAEVALASEVTVADYTKETPTFSTIDLSKLDVDQPLDGEKLLAHHSVYVYSAEWCGFCKKVKAFLKEAHVPYIERDIERSPGAARELAAKAKAAGVQARGIPVTDIQGELIVGYDRPALEARLREVGLLGASEPARDEKKPAGPDGPRPLEQP
jgi:glutaredoxin-like protein NrdH